MSRTLERRPGGFTLLEMMIAMAILAASLTSLVVAVSRNIRAENRAKLMTTATFLARSKIIDVQDALYEKGFGEFEKEATGTFDDKGFQRFNWKLVVDKVELPSVEQMQTVLTKAQQDRQTAQGGGGAGGGLGKGGSSGSGASGMADSPLGGLSGLLGGGSTSSSGSPLSMGAGMLGSQFGMIKEVLEQAIRRVTVRVGWTEGKKPEQVELVTYYVDVRRVDQAIMIGIGATPAPGSPGGAAPGTGTTAPGSAPVTGAATTGVVR